MPESDVLVLPVSRANVLERSENVSASQTPSGTFPLSRLWDGRGSRRFIYPLNQEDEEILVEAQVATGGQFNVWALGVPTGWIGATTGSGTIVEETVSPLVSGSSVELNNGASGTAQIRRDFVAVSGEELDLRVNTQTSNADSAAEVEIQCLETGQYLQSNLQWVPRQVNVGNFAQTSFGQRLPGKIPVPSFADSGGRHTVTLRVRLHMDNAVASRTVHFDNFFLIPPVDLATFHSHNIESRIVPRLSSSDEISLSGLEVDSATRFNGSTHLELNSELAGLLDSKSGVLSFWVEFEGGDATLQGLLANGGEFFQVERLAANTLRIRGENAAGTTILLMATTGTLTADGTRHHVLASWDLATASARLFIDDVSDLAGGPTLTNDTIDYTRAKWLVGSNDSALNKMNGQLSELYFYPGVFLDFSKASIRRRFRTASGKAALLGAAGVNPQGSSPYIYLGNNASSFQANLASRGDFSVASGALVSVLDLEAEASPTSPAFYTRLPAVKHKRFWRLHFRGQQSGDDSNSIAGGEFVLGQAKVLLRNPDQAGGTKVEQIPSIVEDTNVNEIYRVRREQLPQRGFRMRFKHRDAHQLLLTDELYRRTDSGTLPTVFVRDTQKTDVILGATESTEFSERRTSFDRVETDLIFRELSHGVLSG